MSNDQKETTYQRAKKTTDQPIVPSDIVECRPRGLKHGGVEAPCVARKLSFFASLGLGEWRKIVKTILAT